jgi:hypothetical protein
MFPSVSAPSSAPVWEAVPLDTVGALGPIALLLPEHADQGAPLQEWQSLEAVSDGFEGA